MERYGVDMSCGGGFGLGLLGGLGNSLLSLVEPRNLGLAICNRGLELISEFN